MPENESLHVYTVVCTSADADRGSFPEPWTEGSYLLRSRAVEQLNRLADAEKKTLDTNRYDREERTETSWEAYQEGYAAACFVRLEILESELHICE